MLYQFLTNIPVSTVLLMMNRACASAAGRCYSTAAIDYKDDAAYGISTVFLWGVVEMTCLLVVFCVPSVPKALVEGRTSLRRLWSRISIESASKSRAKDSRNSWPLSPLTRVSGNMYQRMDEDNRTRPGASNLMTTASYNPQGDKAHPLESQGGILRVVEFSVREDLCSKGSKASGMQP